MQIDISQNYKKILNKIIQGKDNFLRTFQSMSYEDLDLFADIMLVSFFVNERANLTQISKEYDFLNDKGDSHQNFNPYTAMGYKIVKKQQKPYIRFDNTSFFKVCPNTGLDLENIVSYSFPVYYEAQKVLDKTMSFKLSPPQKRSCNPIASFNSHGCFLNNPKDNCIYFEGQPPIEISEKIWKVSKNNEELESLLNKNDFWENIVECNNKNKKQDTPLELNQYLNFEDALNSLIGGFCHDVFLRTEKYFIVNNIKKPGSKIIFDKYWMKALAESIVKRRCKFNNQEEIKIKLQAYINGRRALEFYKGDKNLNNFINENFEVDENSQAKKYILKRLEKVLNRSFLSNQNGIEFASTLLYTYQSVLNDNSLNKGASIPSILYLYYFSFIEQSVIKKKNSEKNFSLGHSLQAEIDPLINQSQNLLNNCQNLKAINRIIQNTSNKMSEIVEKYSKQHSDTYPFYYLNYFNSIFDIYDTSTTILQDDMDAILYLQPAIIKSNKLFEKTIKKAQISLNKLENHQSLYSFIKNSNDEGSIALKYIDGNLNLKSFYTASTTGNTFPPQSQNIIRAIRHGSYHSSVALFLDNNQKLRFSFLNTNVNKFSSEASRLRNIEFANKGNIFCECPIEDLYTFMESKIIDNILNNNIKDSSSQTQPHTEIFNDENDNIIYDSDILIDTDNKEQISEKIINKKEKTEYTCLENISDDKNQKNLHK